MPSTFGLCDSCVHQRVIGNTRGSRFSLCGRSKHDERFPRYPRMPVSACPGFERPDPAVATGRDDGAGDAGDGAGAGPR